jgi:hypothetical protein
MAGRTFLDTVRRCVYSRWFYAVLGLVCLVDAVAEFLDILNPGENYALDVVSLVSSVTAAVLAFAIFIDLRFRRPKQ